MKILHINTGYATTSLYKNLFVNLVKRNIELIVYAPIRNIKDFDKNKINDSKILIIYSFILNTYTRINYFHKIRKTFYDLVKRIDIKNIKLTHAHFLFSDGGVAFLLFKKFNINYIVAIRDTDINYFYKYFFFLRPFALKILLNSSRIIILSPSYKEYLLKYIPFKYHQAIISKIEIIPNGIDSFWHNNIPEKKHLETNDEIVLLYVGQFIKRKNIDGIKETFRRLKNRGYQVRLVMVGNKNSMDSSIESDIEVCAWASNKEELMSFYRNSHIFIMPSHTETFGLVYIEAMSQGLPVIFSKGQGIDGYFAPNSVGVAVNSRNISSIVEGVEFLINNYDTISATCVSSVENFCWDKISDRYIKIYSEIN